jgi:hypothetical protein
MRSTALPPFPVDIRLVWANGFFIPCLRFLSTFLTPVVFAQRTTFADFADLPWSIHVTTPSIVYTCSACPPFKGCTIGRYQCSFCFLSTTAGEKGYVEVANPGFGFQSIGRIARAEE